MGPVVFLLFLLRFLFLLSLWLCSKCVYIIIVVVVVGRSPVLPPLKVRVNNQQRLLLTLIEGLTSEPVWPYLAIYWTLGNFQNLWQQLICPNLSHSSAIFVKVSKSIIFLVKSFWATFINIWQLFTGHTGQSLLPSRNFC